MKKIILPAMALAAALTSCATDQPNNSSSSSLSDAEMVGINVYSGTTRAIDTVTSTLEDHGEVILHIIDSDTVNQSYTFEYSETDSDWSQSGSTDDLSLIKWGGVTFPASFYSFHDGINAILSSEFSLASAKISGYTVAEESTEHYDLVYHASSLNTTPTGGAVNAYHKHALSKLHVNASTGSCNAYIARVRLVNVDNTGDLTITPLEATSTETGAKWSNNTDMKSTFNYFYIGKETMLAINSSLNNDSPVLINNDEYAPMMIIPQNTTAATIGVGDGTTAAVSGSYIEVIYYLTDSEDQPVVGYESVASCPDALEYSDDDQKTTLYVMAAFPMEQDFEVNKIYNINLGLGATGSTGGKLLVDYFVDQDGKAVSLTLKSTGTTEDEVDVPGVEPGDDLLASSDDYIDISVSVGTWGDSSDVTLD